MEWLRILLGPIVSIIVLLIGGAVMFGKFKEKCEDNDKKIDKAERAFLKRIEKIEGNDIVTTVECDRRLSIYKTLMCGKIDDLEKVVVGTSKVAERDRRELVVRINKNRDEVIGKFESINLFIGETRTIMNLLRSRFLEENS